MLKTQISHIFSSLSIEHQMVFLPVSHTTNLSVARKKSNDGATTKRSISRFVLNFYKKKTFYSKTDPNICVSKTSSFTALSFTKIKSSA